MTEPNQPTLAPEPRDVPLIQHEDELPIDITQEEYDRWFGQSEIIDGVRMGPKFPLAAAVEVCPECEHNEVDDEGVCVVPVVDAQYPELLVRCGHRCSPAQTLDPETDAAFDDFLRTDPDVQAVLREKAAERAAAQEQND